MEPKDPNKKFDDLFKNFSFSFILPSSNGLFYYSQQETPEEMIVRLDEIDEMVDTMTEYPQAKKMLDKLYGKS
jgi:hypothetical protein